MKKGRRVNDKLKIGVVLPTRGDRPQFLNFAIEQLNNQTRQADVIEIVDDPPENQEKDITKRYRIGCQRIIKKNVDLIFFIEDDDWYDKQYIEKMIKKWQENGKPDLFGINSTVYYHLKTKKCINFNHPERASAMNTIVTPQIIKNIIWPPDDEVSFDLYLWNFFKGKTCNFEKKYSIGIKHGIGLSGGIGHDADNYKNSEEDPDWLKNNVDSYAFDVYEKINADYFWEYLIPSNNNRTETLVKIISPIIKDKNLVIFDNCCGFSPLCHFFNSLNCQYFLGIDLKCDYCIKNYKYKNTIFENRNIDKININEFSKKFNCLIHLGISKGLHPIESKKELNLTKEIIKNHNPKWILLESVESNNIENIVSEEKYENIINEKYYIETKIPTPDWILNRKILVYKERIC